MFIIGKRIVILRLVSCGSGNIRVWKAKRGSLRSYPLDLGLHVDTHFTDIGFEQVERLVQDSKHRKLYASTTCGSLFEIDCKSFQIQYIHQLLPIKQTQSAHAQKSNVNDRSTGIQCISLNDAICATGSNDGYIRLWPLDFQGPFMEAEHEGSVTAVRVSTDGRMVSAETDMLSYCTFATKTGASYSVKEIVLANAPQREFGNLLSWLFYCEKTQGNLGLLDIATKSYKTLVRSHLKEVLSFSFDNIRSHVATVSADESIKIWRHCDGNRIRQLYDFRAPGERPGLVAFHPVKELLACGFDSGRVRVFDIASTSLLVEHKYHKGKLTGLSFTPDGNHMHSSDAKGSLALYDATDNSFELVRLLPNSLAKADIYSSKVIAVDGEGKRLACIGPSEFLITVYDARSLDELLRIDITSMAGSSSRSVVDAATLLCYTPTSTGHLVAVTANARLLKLETNTGQLLTEVSNIHRGRVTAVCVSPGGKYLATAGDKVIKIWDYHMRMDLNFQVFIGHSDPIRDIKFTVDGLQLFSIGECLFVWDFHGKDVKPKRQTRKSPRRMIDLTHESVDHTGEGHNETEHERNNTSTARPRSSVPQPTEYEPLDLSFSPIPQKKPEKSIDNHLDLSSEDSTGQKSDESGIEEHVDEDGIPSNPILDLKARQQPIITDISPVPAATMETVISHHASPSVLVHFKMRDKVSKLAEKRYTAPPSQAGLRLKSVVGYDGLGRNNLIWHQETGLFAYTSGCIVVIEDLMTGPTSLSSHLCIWEVSTQLCRKHLDHHKHAVIAMQYSRDDRFLITIGDYRECSVVVWSTRDYDVLATSFTKYPIHAVQWDPYTMNEFTTIGQNGSTLFWLLDETKRQAVLNVHEAEIPEDVFSDNQ
eukprot:gene8708-9637_t